MKNFVQDGKQLKATAGVAVSSGDVVIFNQLIGVALASAATGEEFTLVVEGVYRLAKASGLAINFGDKVYWDNVNKNVTKTATGNTLLGACTQSALAGDAGVEVKLIGTVI